MHLRSFISLAALLIVATIARADRLADIRQRGTLRWGADQEGGGPFVYPDPADPDRAIGFEVEIADVLAAELGVRAEFCQRNWEALPEFLRKGEIDIILNGYEWTASRASRMEASRPYYIYELQLVGPAKNSRIKSWADLDSRVAGDGEGQTSGLSRPSISVLGGSSSEMYLRKRYGDRIDIVGYNGNTDAMAKVRDGVHDATLEDLPIAIFYRDQPQARGLRFIDQPVARGYYAIYAQKGERRLIGALNAAILKGIADGRLRAIYERYGMWNRTQEGLASADPITSPPEVSGEDEDAADTEPIRGWRVVERNGWVLVKAAWKTVQLSVLSMPLAIIIGLFVALGRLYGPAYVRAPLTLYVEVLRGTPVLLQLYFIYFLLPTMLPPRIGQYFDAFYAAIIGLAINYSAYEAEIYRAGLQAIPKGQMEAALALGMTKWTALRRVIVPQAVRIVIPPVTNDFIALFKDTSVCSVIAVVELTKQYSILANSADAIVELAAITALLYMAMSYPLSIVSRRVERLLAGEYKLAVG